jgi:hypothetical protein
MDILTIAAFVAFFALVLAWLAAPAGVEQPAAAAIDANPLGAD